MDQEKSEQEKYDELYCYALNHSDPPFILQYVVDAHAAQCADENTKPIKLAFALIGLYLHIEKNYSGKDVQKAHMQLAKRRRQWPTFTQPKKRGSITVSDVIRISPGRSRDLMIQKWCTSVWEAYNESHKQVIDLVQRELYRM